MSWIPLHNHSYFSLLDGLSKPKQIAARCVELDYGACAITDHGNLASSVQFISAMKDKGIKPILGCELYICKDDPIIQSPENGRPYSHLPVLAKDLEGWHQLVQLSSFTHHKDHAYYHPRISLDRLADFTKGKLIGFSGHPGSDLANCLFVDPKIAYRSKTYHNAASCLDPDFQDKVKNLVERYQSIFGKENFFVEIQKLDTEVMPSSRLIADILRSIAGSMEVPRIGTGDAHYPRREDAEDQRVLLCSALKTTKLAAERRIANGEDTLLEGFFRGSCFHIMSPDEIAERYDEEEIENTKLISDMCDSYDIRHSPMLPRFPGPEGVSADDYMTDLCRVGWSKRIKGRVENDRLGVYADRIKKELGVINEAGLSNYFLIVQDYCNWARSQGMIIGPGRGSGAGCLISYLLGITNIDPIKYNLRFERFYNKGRNTETHISLPDIDSDFPVDRREDVIRYVKNKFGEDRVAQIATFNSLKGRGALTEVLRAYEVDFNLVKIITSLIPQEGRISAELQAMVDRGDDPSSIRYVLENDPDSFRDWCVLKDDNTLEGEYAPYFAQAMRLEGTKKNVSKHASGVVIGSQPLASLCPMIYNSDDDIYLAGMEFPDLEAMGQAKFDILGVAAFSKIAGVQKQLLYGTIADEDADCSNYTDVKD